MGFFSKLPARARALFILAVLTLVAGALWLSAIRPQSPPAPVPLTLAMPVQVSSSALFMAQERQLFPKHGLSVTLQPFQLGMQALQSVIDGKADLAFVADTPFVLAVLRGKQVAAVATVFQSRRSMALFARADSAIRAPDSLRGKTVGTVIGTNAAYFLDTLLDVHGIARDSVRIVGLRPEQLPAALASGQVDAVTVWHPDLARLEQEYRDGTTLYGEDFFVYRFLLVGKKSYIDGHPAQIRRILATLDESHRQIKADPARARALVGERLGIAPALLARAFEPGDFSLALDQTLLLGLSDQTRWAMDKHIVPPQAFPDYLDFIRHGPLTALMPDANQMIR